MPTIDDLLSVTTASIKPETKLPAGLYEAVITQYELLPFHWANANIHGRAYVPTIQLLRSLDAENEADPEAAAEHRRKLEEFGDWTKKTYSFSYTNKDAAPPRKEASVSEVNFPLIETTTTGQAVGMLDTHAWRFYLKSPEPPIGDGRESGFVIDKLGMHNANELTLGELLDATQGLRFVVQIDYEPRRKDPTRTDLRIMNTFSLEEIG